MNKYNNTEIFVPDNLINYQKLNLNPESKKWINKKCNIIDGKLSIYDDNLELIGTIDLCTLFNFTEDDFRVNFYKLYVEKYCCIHNTGFLPRYGDYEYKSVDPKDQPQIDSVDIDYDQEDYIKNNGNHNSDIKYDINHGFISATIVFDCVEHRWANTLGYSITRLFNIETGEITQLPIIFRERELVDVKIINDPVKGIGIESRDRVCQELYLINQLFI